MQIDRCVTKRFQQSLHCSTPLCSLSHIMDFVSFTTNQYHRPDYWMRLQPDRCKSIECDWPENESTVFNDNAKLITMYYSGQWQLEWMMIGTLQRNQLRVFDHLYSNSWYSIWLWPTVPLHLVEFIKIAYRHLQLHCRNQITVSQ